MAAGLLEGGWGAALLHCDCSVHCASNGQRGGFGWRDSIDVRYGVCDSKRGLYLKIRMGVTWYVGDKISDVL